MHNSLRRGASVKDSMKYRRFGKESVLCRSKIFRSLLLTHILKLTFFGSNCTCIREKEISCKTKKTIVIHIHSRDRMIDLFQKGGVCAFLTHDKEDSRIQYGSSGRAVLRSKDSGLQVVGFVLGESASGDVLELQLETNEMVHIPTPKFCNISEQWEYGFHSEYDVVEYDPIRIKVQEYGNIHFFFHRFEFNKEDNKIIPST